MIEKIEKTLQTMCKSEGVPLTKHTDSSRSDLEVIPGVEVLIDPTHTELTVYTLFVDPFHVAEVEANENSYRIVVKKDDKPVYQSFKHYSNEASYISTLYAIMRSIFDGKPVDQDPENASNYLIGYFKESAAAC